jgi:integrin alpha FG-GAP repeat containing protein 1
MDLCVADISFRFDLTDSPDNTAFVRFPVSSVIPSTSSLLVYDTTFTPPIPIPLKLGDADLDGFPDMLAISAQGHDRTPRLVYSVPCAVGLGGCSKSGAGRRGWKIATKGVEALENIKDARSITFLDTDEDVRCSGVTFKLFVLELSSGLLGYHGSTHR